MKVGWLWGSFGVRTYKSVMVPCFKIELKNDLKRSLKSLGLNEAFDFSIGFSSINSDEPLQISQVIHNTFLEVKEEAAEAAAVTAIALGIEMASMEGHSFQHLKISKHDSWATGKMQRG